MKHTIKLLLGIALAALAAVSCKDALYPECQTSPTTSYLFTSAEGLQKAAVGLYALDRALVNSNEGALFCVIMMDFSTDLMVNRTGTSNALANLDNVSSATSEFGNYWKTYYALSGRANEIIAAARELGLDDPAVARVYGEACCFRARALFLLWQRYERLYLDTEPVTVENAFGRTFRASSTEEILGQIKDDLKEAETYLGWEMPKNGTNVEYGRVTKAVAKHIRAQVAMWEKDWKTAAAEVDEIFANGTYHMDESTSKVFSGANLTSPEVLYAFQFSNQPGGGNTIRNGVVMGHQIPLVVTPSYGRQTGFVWTNEYGGYGWGRVFPNTYLLGLYDQAKDKRYKELFQHEWYYNDPSNPDTYGKLYSPTGSAYQSSAHPSTLKYYDKWTHTDNPQFTSSFKDLVIYRLAETALIGAEAYFHMEGGGSANAKKYYNMTWKRAGNAEFTGTLTLEDILEETARECHFEGVRWNQLKRLGILGERVRLHAQDTQADDPRLPADKIDARRNFRDDRDTRWPIPLSELEKMPGYGQSDGWN